MHRNLRIRRCYADKTTELNPNRPTMRKKPAASAWPEVFFSSSETSTRVSAALKRGELRRIGPRLYTPRLDLEPAQLIRKHWRTVVAGYFPGAVIGFRTVLDGRPTATGEVFITADTRRLVQLEGLRISAIEGPGALDGDMPLPQGLIWASRARALLESARPSRARGATARGLRTPELEAYLERFLQIEGEARLNALRDHMRRLARGSAHDDQPRALDAASLPDADAAFETLDGMIGTLLGTRRMAMSAPTALARLAGTPVDNDRLQLMERLHGQLAGMLLPAPHDPAPRGPAASHLAFLDAYFSNYIEGTEFEIGEAREIVFEGKVVPQRADDTHDVVGTFELVSEPTFMHRDIAERQEPDAFLVRLQAANRQVLRGRPTKRPGEFKEVANRAGNTVFVAPELVRGTLREGYALVRALEHPFARAAALMFLITEVHPFNDGNGRVARAFMNAELVAAGQCRILIPTVFRDDYVGGLRVLSRQGHAEPLISALTFAQQVTSRIPYEDLDEAIRTLEACRAFDDDEDARLRMPAL